MLTLILLPAQADAQLPSPDATALGLGAPSPAMTRGFAAISANPSALGVEGSPPWSVTALAVEIRNGLDPISLGELARWEDRDMPRNVRAAWLDDVTRAGSESGAAGLDVTFVALSRGRVGVQLSARASGEMALNPDAVELLLFGNAGLIGQPRDFRLSGSRGDGFLVSTASVAYGRPATVVKGGTLHVGGTASIFLGHAVAIARDNGSGLTGDPTELDLRFPILHVGDGANGPVHGHGFGLDVGALWIRGPWSVGATLRNLLNTFAWDPDDLVLQPGSAFFDPERSKTDFDERPAEEAPPVLLDALDRMTFPAVLAAGASYRLRPELTVAADMAWSPGGGMAVDPDAHLGLGAEYRPPGRLSVTGGVAIVERGVQLSAGAGLGTGRFRGSIGAAFRTGALDDMLLGSLSVAFRPR